MGVIKKREDSLLKGGESALINQQERQHLERFFINLFHEKLSYRSVDTSKSHLGKYDLEMQTANFIGLVVECCLLEGENPLFIKNKKDAVSMIQKHSGIIEIKNLLNSIKPADKLKEVLSLSGTKKDIEMLWLHPERSSALHKVPKKLEALRSEVLDTLYWIRIVKELCQSGNKRLLAKFTSVKEVGKFNFETVFQKDTIFTTLIISSVLGEIKNEFSFEDIKKFEEVVAKDSKWDESLASRFEKLFAGSNFADIPFAEIPFVQNMVVNIKGSLVPLKIGKRIVLDTSSKSKVWKLDNLKTIHFQTFLSTEDDSGLVALRSDFLDTVATISKLVDKENCLIFEDIFFVEPRLLMFLNKTQLKRLVFANRLHGMFDDDGLRKVFIAADLLLDYDEALLFADKALAPHVFSKILTEPENQTILKDVIDYQEVKTLRGMPDKFKVSKGKKFSGTKAIILKLISLAGKKNRMNKKAYARFLLSLAENSKEVVDEKIMTALYLVYSENSLPTYIVEFAKKQDWYDLIDENARKYFAL